MKLFEYEFMRLAFLTGMLLAVIIPLIGMVIVLKRLSMIGDALSHSSLAGVAGGMILGINPVVGAVVTSVAAALGIEAVRRKIPRYSELAVAVVMSAGVGLAGVLSGFASGANFNNFLFGSIVAISHFELYLVFGVSAAVLLAVVVLYKELFYISFDERSARLAGIRVGVVNFIFVILTALTVSIAARTVGALIVSSMMVVPVACAMQVGRSYRSTMLFSVAFAEFFTVVGLFLSYYKGLRPGGTIVLVGVATLVVLLPENPCWERKGGCDMCHQKAQWPKALKKTKQRQLVLEVLTRAEAPMTALDLTAHLERRGTPVSLSTVYRVLDNFIDHGMASKTAVLENGMAVYELAGHHRHYAVCLCCHRIIPLENCPLESFAPKLRDGDFSITGHRLQLYGYCSGCSK